ncbi:MAG: nitrile hydratase subunit alpha [Acidisphaera sp.]|nr:nitrile hydratase subunit alpha [Acidisphaera sp.]
MNSPIEAESTRLLDAVRSLLLAKNVTTPQEIAERIRITDAASPAQGARMVAKAWCDPKYRALMLADGTKAAEALGIAMRGAPPLGVLEDTGELHNLVVCTLCSCYPRAVLGYPPFWFKSAAYRARAVRDPRGVLAEWGTVLPEATRVRVVDSTADYRWMVLPLRPAGTEDWPEERLAALVREGDMIGVTLPDRLAVTRPGAAAGPAS